MARTVFRPGLSGMVAAALLAGAAHAETPSERHHRALVAGYKAAFTCSATFLSDRPRAAIEENELSGIYPDYRTAYDAWKSAAQKTVDNAKMRYFIVHMHKLIDPEAQQQQQQ